MLYVTVYVLGVEAETSITPVLALIDKPAGEEKKVPPVTPVIVGVGSGPSGQ